VNHDDDESVTIATHGAGERRTAAGRMKQRGYSDGPIIVSTQYLGHQRQPPARPSHRPDRNERFSNRMQIASTAAAASQLQQIDYI